MTPMRNGKRDSGKAGNRDRKPSFTRFGPDDDRASSGSGQFFQGGAFSLSMSEKDFQRCSQFVQSELGIKMPPAKKTMLESRLRKRLRCMSMDTFEEYVEYVFSPEGRKHELVNMMDAVTTNKTDFFREPAHFDHLLSSVLPDLVDTSGIGVRRPLHAWSAGCSTGEEPYTLAMVLQEFSERCSGFNFRILGTDISTRVLDTAVRGVYAEEKVEPVPQQMKKKYLMKSRDRQKPLVRVVPELRKKVTFCRVNLMNSNYGIGDKIDIVFCRNVIIYFEKQTQEELINRLCDQLDPGGYLFLGHSETLHGMTAPLVQAAPMVYRKKSI